MIAKNFTSLLYTYRKEVDTMTRHSDSYYFKRGVQVIVTAHRNRVEEQPFNRSTIIDLVKQYARMGFRHVGNRGRVAILSYYIGKDYLTVELGDVDGMCYINFIEQTTLKQTS